jgi:hypothetical protein
MPSNAGLVPGDSNRQRVKGRTNTPLAPVLPEIVGPFKLDGAPRLKIPVPLIPRMCER